ncbi:MAG: ribulose-phosphate 3-epimerase [Gemmiger sp.]|nr:ribulose-phosphate 3-epimerase [Gemmiger sp.]
MAKLSASILAADFSALGTACAQVLGAGCDMLHIDVMDGHFVPNISYGAPVLQSLHRALPRAYYDVHLMISDPARYLEDFARAGADSITFHPEAVADPAALLDAIEAVGCRAGMSIKPATPVEVLLPYLNRLSIALVMSVEPGFGGQKFMPQALEKIKTLRAARDAGGFATEIEVDGGIALASGTAAACVQAGATLLVAGSAVFAAPDPAAAVAGLRAL